MESDRRKFYGTVTVSRRGQIVIPVGARRDFGIEPGDKLLVFGDLDQGLALGTVDLVRKTMHTFLSDVGPIVDAEAEPGEERDDSDDTPEA